MAQAAHRFFAAENEIISENVRNLHEREQIQPSCSEWASNPVLVRHDGKIRFCVDFRDVNKVTRKDSHGLGNISDMLQKLSAAVVLSTLDLASGFHQIPLSESARAKTAFREGTTGRLWEYLVAPFGMVNLPAVFTRLMHQVLGEVLGVLTLVYVDDILVCSSFEQHLVDLDEVLTRLRSAGLSCSLGKSHLFQEEVEYLGHLAGTRGIRPDSEK